MTHRYPPARFEIMTRPTRISRNNTNRNATGKMTFRKQLDQYLDQASLHGLRYIGDRTITWFERIFFFCMLSLVLILAGNYIFNMWIKWAEQTIVTVIPNQLPTKTFPFPAVTICNTNVVRKSVIEQMTPNSVEHSIARAHCDRDEWHLSNSSYPRPIMYGVLAKVSQPCDELLVKCRFGQVKMNCSDLFRPVKTERGMCCMFNAIPRHKFYKRPSNKSQYNKTKENPWHPETGFEQTHLRDPYAFPQSFIGMGIEHGLRLTLNGNTSDRYCSVYSNGGFIVQLHNVYEQPLPTDYGHLIKNGYETRVAILPDYLQTMPNVEKVPKLVRRCLFQDENPLDFFGTYSQTNCVEESFTNRLFDVCNCTFLSMPAIYRNATICSEAHAKCIEDFSDPFDQFRASLRDVCLESCWESSYRSKMSFAQLKNNSVLSKITGLMTKDLAILNIYYPLPAVRVYRKAMLYSFTEFLSSIGGLLGFFLGFSLISIVEILYFICIRPHCISRQMPRRKIKPQPKPEPIRRIPKKFDPYAKYHRNYISTIYLE